MLPKNHRLTRQQFWQVQQEGYRVQGLGFSIRYLLNDIGYSRFAVVTSAKLSKKAVVRNKLRRQIYRVLNIEHWILNIDAIIFPQASVLNLSDEKICSSLDQVLSRIPQPLSRP